jgi:hypothetical protein
MGQASSLSDGYLTAADWVTLNNKQVNLGYRPVNPAGDTMTGSLNMNNMGRITNLPEPLAPGDATNKTYVDDQLALKADSAGLGALANKDQISAGDITPGTIFNTDIAATAAIADTKLATIATPGKVSGNAITSGTITGSTRVDTTGSVAAQGVTVKGDGTNASELRFGSKTNTNFVSFKAPDTLTKSTVFTLPSTDGTIGQLLATDGTGSLAWINPPSAPVSTVAGKTGDILLNTNDVAEGTNRYFTEGRARGSISVTAPLAYNTLSG